ncbi:MAG TPA: isoprenylcysteine carboxylmethyltransferase family protein [Longimicrobium sp.]|nr:isoprenylcysteine carboxylmethyltransferase family protein [Longimicrobium sp.]
MRLIRHLLSILALPTVMAGVVPYLLVSSRPSPLMSIESGATGLARAALGAAFIAGGLVLACATIWHFATRGRGTLAPWDPPTRLVVTGMYRHVRNPMITGVLMLVIGEALLLRSAAVGWWAGAFFLVNAIYIPLLEEPGLERRFGEPYRAYRRAVPRWIPRPTPWTPPNAEDASSTDPY